MRKNWLVYFCFLVIAFVPDMYKAQDIHFSQFYESPILLNPAAAGASQADWRLALNYKNQWKSVMNPFKTAAIGFDTKLFNKGTSKSYLGLGVSLFNDKAGVSKFTTNQANVDIAWHLNADSNNMISLGVKPGFFQKYVNPAGLKWDNQFDGIAYDASRASGENMSVNNLNNFDMGAGIAYTYKKPETGLRIQAGGAVAHLTKPKNSFYAKDESTNLKITGHLSAQIHPKEKRFILLPSLLFVKQGGHTEAVGGSNIAFSLVKPNTPAKFTAIHFGAFYRLNDAAVFVAALEYKSCMKFAMSYDVNVSRLTSASKFRGGPEFSFVWTGFRKEKAKPELAAKDSVVAVPEVVVALPPAEKPAVGVYSGSVFGEEDKPVKANIFVTPVKTDTATNTLQTGETIAYTSDSTTGNYRIDLKPGTKYKLKVAAPGFELYEEEVDLTNLSKYTENQKDFHLTASKPVAKTTETVTTPVNACTGKPKPDVSEIRKKSMSGAAAYKQLLDLLGDYCAEGLEFKIQVAAYRKAGNYNYKHLKQYGTPEIKEYPDGITRFTMGGFKTINDAESLRLKLASEGQKDAWITVFYNGQRMTLEQFIGKEFGN